MTPRRLIPYVVIFLILAGAYVGLRWRQEQQVARDEQAKKVFHLKETDISDLSLVRGKDEVRLVKKDQVWHLTAPLNTKADQTVVDSMLTTLARLRKERDLGAEKDLKPFGLDKPGLVVKFTAQGQPHQLAVGAKVPGDQNYYALKDQDPHLLTISMGSKDSLDRQLLALRDKTLLAFIIGEVKGLKVKSPKTAVALEKTGPQTWRWVGRPDFRVRGDRVEKLLRDLHIARARNFLEPPPKNLAALGLVPDRQTEITVVTPAGDQTLWLGAKKDDAVYARIRGGRAGGAGGCSPGRRGRQDPGVFGRPPPVVRGHSRRPPGRLGPPRQDLDRPERPGCLEDHRAGPGGHAAARGAAGDGPVEFPEAGRRKNPAPGRRPDRSPAFVLELLDQAGKPLLHLEEVGALGKGPLKVLTRAGDKTVLVLVPRAPFRQWQEEMHRLTASAEPAGPSPEKGESGKGGKD